MESAADPLSKHLNRLGIPAGRALSQTTTETERYRVAPFVTPESRICVANDLAAKIKRLAGRR